MTYRPELDAGLDAIVGVSEWTRRLCREILRVAAYPSSVLITGPSGTGKELIARALHAHSRRAERAFIPVDCAATTGTLFVSHLFGHVQGAFTGAAHDEIGCFRAADGGTIFLDEVGELSLELQATLLRVLQERTVVPVGSHKEIPVDVRVVAATNRDLSHDVAAGRFREDLYFRLNVVPIRTLPLKDHIEDVEVLASHFLAKLAVNNGVPLKTLSRGAVQRMRAYDWPGNVREMENILERAVLFSKGDSIGADAIPGRDAAPESTPLPPVSRPAPGIAAWQSNCPSDEAWPVVATSSPPSTNPHWPTMAEIEQEHVRRTLDRTNYNQSDAARLLKMNRQKLLRTIQKYGIDISRSKRGRPAKG